MPSRRWTGSGPKARARQREGRRVGPGRQERPRWHRRKPERGGDYRVLKDDSNGDSVPFYYYDASGALTVVVTRSGGKFQCTAGLVPTIAPPCFTLNTGTALVCSTDGGAPD